MEKQKAIYRYSIKREKLEVRESFGKTCSPSDVAEFARAQGWHELEQECIWTIVLDRKNSIKAYYLVTMGLVDRSMGHPREVFRQAILSAATAIIMIHNHPSGNCKPSFQDIELTKKMKSAGEIIGINLIDHVIVGDNNHYSLADNGEI